jgi:YD repeat-containing protein
LCAIGSGWAASSARAQDCPTIEDWIVYGEFAEFAVYFSGVETPPTGWHSGVLNGQLVPGNPGGHRVNGTFPNGQWIFDTGDPTDINNPTRDMTRSGPFEGYLWRQYWNGSGPDPGAEAPDPSTDIPNIRVIQTAADAGRVSVSQPHAIDAAFLAVVSSGWVDQGECETYYNERDYLTGPPKWPITVSRNGTVMVARRPDLFAAGVQFDIQVGVDNSTPTEEIEQLAAIELSGHALDIPQSDALIPVRCRIPTLMTDGTAEFNASALPETVRVFDDANGTTELGQVVEWDVSVQGDRVFYLKVEDDFDQSRLILDNPKDDAEGANGPLMVAGDDAYVESSRCNKCDDCTGASEGSNASVDFRIDLGSIDSGEDAGYLYVYAREPEDGVNLADPKRLVRMLGQGLQVNGGFDSNGDTITATGTGSDWGRVRLVVHSTTKYDLVFERETAPSTWTAYRTITVDNVNWVASTHELSDKVHFQESHVIGGTTVRRVWHYEWDPGSDPDGWVLKEGEADAQGNATYLRVTRRTQEKLYAQRTDTVTVEESGGAVVSETTERYMRYAWGEELMERIVDPDGAALREAWTYYADRTGDGDNFGQLASYLSETGYWERYFYDEGTDVGEDFDYQTTVVRQLGDNQLGGTDDAADNVATETTHYWSLTLPGGGSEVVEVERVYVTVDGTRERALYTVIRDGGTTVANCTEHWEFECADTDPESGYADLATFIKAVLDGTYAGELIVTKTWRWKDGLATDDSDDYEIFRMVAPDGMVTEYDRTDGAGGLTRTVEMTEGYKNAADTAWVYATRTTRTVDERGNQVTLLTEQIEEGVSGGSPIVVSLSKRTTADDFGRALRTDYYFGFQAKAESTTPRSGTAEYNEQTVYDCGCGNNTASAFIDRTGVQTRFEYNIFGWVVERGEADGSVGERVMKREFDAAGRILVSGQDVDGGGLSFAGGVDRVTTNTYDKAGRLTSSQDPEGRMTYYVYRRVTPGGAEYDPETDTGVFYWETRTYGHDNNAPVQVSWVNSHGEEVLVFTASTSDTWASGSEPDGSETLVEETRTVTLHDWANRWTEVRVYTDIATLGVGLEAANEGTAGTHYFVAQAAEYDDALGRPRRTTDAHGNITETVYETGTGREVGMKWGTPGNLHRVTWLFYHEFAPTDGAKTPSGNARPYVTRAYTVEPNLATAPADNATLSDYVYTDYERTYEEDTTGAGGALLRTNVWTRPEHGPLTRTMTDHRGLPEGRRVYSNEPTPLLLTSSATTYNSAGQAATARQEEVDLDSVQTADDQRLTGDAIETTYLHDAAGRLVRVHTQGQGCVKFVYDEFDRIHRTLLIVSVGASEDPDAANHAWLNDDVVLEETVNHYDLSGNLIQTDTYQRLHNAPGTPGRLSATPLLARVTYQAQWFDNHNRVTASANYGTNGGAAFTRPASAPAAGSAPDSVLVSHIAYGDDGMPRELEDNENIKTLRLYDDALRQTALIEAWDGVLTNPNAPGSRGADENRVTVWDYDGVRIASLTAVDPDHDGVYTDNQTTRYVYAEELTDKGAAVPDNSALRAIISADSSDTVASNALSPAPGSGADRIEFTYYADGAPRTITDPRGVQWTAEYTPEGYLDHRRVTSTGTWTAGTGDVQRIGFTYGKWGEPLSTTAYSAAAGGASNEVSEVTYAYGSYYRLAEDLQNHNPGAFGGGIALGIERVYETNATNGIFDHASRLHQIKLPNGRTLELSYGNSGSIDDTMNRVAGIGELTAAGGATPVPITAYSYLGRSALVRKDYQGPDVRRDFTDETGEGTSGSDPYDRAVDRFGRVIEDQWERYDDQGDGSADILRTAMAYDGVSNVRYAHRKVYGSQSLTYDYDDFHQMTGRDVGPLETDTQGDLVLTGGDAEVQQFWEMHSRQNTLDQLGNVASSGNHDQGSYTGTDINQANELTQIDTDPRTGDQEHASYFSNGSEASRFQATLNCTQGQVTVSGGALKIAAGSPTAPAVVLTDFEYGAASFAASFRVPASHTTGGLVGVVIGYKSPTDYWVYAKDFDSTGSTSGDWLIYHMHDANGNGSIDYSDPNEREHINGVATGGTTPGQYYGLIGYAASNTLDIRYAGTDLSAEGGFPSGSYGLYTEVTDAEFDYARYAPKMAGVALSAGWHATGGSYVIEAPNSNYGTPPSGGGNGVLVSSGTYYRKLDPALVRGLRASRFQATFSMQRSTNSPTYTHSRFVFNYRGPNDYDYIRLSHHTTSEAPVAYALRDGGQQSTLSINTDLSGSRLPAVANTYDTLWYRVVSDGTDVKVFAATTEAGLDTRQTNDEWCMRTTATTDRFGFEDGPGMIGFMGQSYTVYFDNITVKTDEDNDADLTDDSTYEVTEIVETFDLYDPAGGSSYTALRDHPQHDKQGNLSFDGGLAYEYDARGLLVRVYNGYWDPAAGGGSGDYIKGSLIQAYAYGPTGRMISRRTYSAEGLDNVEHLYYHGWSVVETRDGLKGGGRVVSQYIWDSMANTGLADDAHHLDSLAQVGHNLNPGVDDDSETAGTQDHIDRRFYPLQDRQQNVMALVDETGALVERYEYTGSGQRVTYTRAGIDMTTYLQADLNGDGQVTSADTDLVTSHWGQTVTPGDRQKGDANGDGIVNIDDLDLVFFAVGQSLSNNDAKAMTLKSQGLGAPGSVSFGTGAIPGGALCAFGYTGQLHDDVVQVVHMRFRVWSSNELIGRFLTRDPAGMPNGSNPYLGYFMLWGVTDPYGLDASCFDDMYEEILASALESALYEILREVALKLAIRLAAALVANVVPGAGQIVSLLVSVGLAVAAAYEIGKAIYGIIKHWEKIKAELDGIMDTLKDLDCACIPDEVKQQIAEAIGQAIGAMAVGSAAAVRAALRAAKKGAAGAAGAAALVAARRRGRGNRNRGETDCFLAGTPVLLRDEVSHQPIETLDVGQRVTTDGQERDGSELDGPIAEACGPGNPEADERDVQEQWYAIKLKRTEAWEDGHEDHMDVTCPVESI